MLKNFNPKDLRENPLQRGRVDAEQVLNLGLLLLLRVRNQVSPKLILKLGQGLGPLR